MKSRYLTDLLKNALEALENYLTPIRAQKIKNKKVKYIVGV